MFQAKAKVVFDPTPISGLKDKMFKPWWVIAVVDGQHGKDLGDYYRFFLEKRFGSHTQVSYTDSGEKLEKTHFGLRLQLPAWGTHISVVRGERVDNKNWEFYKTQYNNKIIEFEYDISPKTSGVHWWLSVRSEELLDLRELMGLQRNPKFRLHLTLGSPTPMFLEKNEYIHKLYKNGFLDKNN